MPLSMVNFAMSEKPPQNLQFVLGLFLVLIVGQVLFSGWVYSDRLERSRLLEEVSGSLG